MSDESDSEESSSDELSPEEQFERALEDLSEVDLDEQKFDDAPESGEPPGGGDDAGAAEQSAGALAEELGEVDRENLPEKREGADSESGDELEEEPSGPEPEHIREFEAAMWDVDEREDRSKYRSPSEPDPDEYLEEGESRTAEDFVTPTLPKSGEGLNDVPPLDEAQEAMLERCERWERRGEVPELNLRGESGSEARSRLRRFLQQASAEGARFVRIIHGRGKKSEGPPVVKPAVLDWLETAGVDRIRGYVPERQFGGDYGATVVELRREQ